MRAVLWDMDGTLLDSEPAHEAAFDDAIAELGVDLPAGFHGALLGASNDQVHAALIAATCIDMAHEEWVALKWRHYRRHVATIERREPSASVAEKFAAGGVVMALVSNSTADEVALNLAATGMSSVFSLTVSRCDVQNGKPAPDGYLMAARRLGCTAEQCLVIEDSPTGARAGLAAGMTVVFHPQSHSSNTLQDVVLLDPEASPEDQIVKFINDETVTVTSLADRSRVLK